MAWRGCVDLMTVAMHEVGHVLGFDHSYSGEMAPSLMAAILSTGERLALLDAAPIGQGAWAQESSVPDGSASDALLSPSARLETASDVQVAVSSAPNAGPLQDEALYCSRISEPKAFPTFDGAEVAEGDHTVPVSATPTTRKVRRPWT